MVRSIMSSVVSVIGKPSAYCRNSDATEAMRVAATGNHRDAPLLVGESGAAGLAGLMTLLQQSAWKMEAGLDADSRVLLISTEGATAPSVYAECVGETAESASSPASIFHADS